MHRVQKCSHSTERWHYTSTAHKNTVGKNMGTKKNIMCNDIKKQKENFLWSVMN